MKDQQLYTIPISGKLYKVSEQRNNEGVVMNNEFVPCGAILLFLDTKEVYNEFKEQDYLSFRFLGPDGNIIEYRRFLKEGHLGIIKEHIESVEEE